jgi:hypothetical protein
MPNKERSLTTIRVGAVEQVITSHLGQEWGTDSIPEHRGMVVATNKELLAKCRMELPFLGKEYFVGDPVAA